MIANPALKSAFWITGFAVILGNSYVIVSTIILFLGTKRSLGLSKMTRFQRLIVFNISIADLLMGIYLIIIAAYSTKFSGYYGVVDAEWRSSLTCSVIGSLAVISSQTSCFLMVILSTFRLMNILRPIKSLSSSLISWKICMLVSWLLSLSLAICPILNFTSHYFIHTLTFTTKFFKHGEVTFGGLKKVMCRYTSAKNITLYDNGNELQSIEIFLKNHLPSTADVRKFGFYSETSVCMPRFYVARGDTFWEYTLSVITLNFICFIFIALSYLFIFKKSSKSTASVRNNKSNKTTITMQKRITRIVATDFLCWVLICIMAYVRLCFSFSDIVYQITAVILLPINSALNPILFSSLPDNLISLMRRLKPYKSYFSYRNSGLT